MLRKLITPLTLALVLLLGPAATAHDELIDISPAEGAVLTSGDVSLVLTFNNPLLVVDGESGAEIQTRLVGSEEWTSQEIEIEEQLAKSTFTLTESGDYELRWKVISSDGHAITGESTFTLQLETSEETEAPILIAPNPNEATETDGQDGMGLFWIGLGLVVLGAVFAPIGLMMRRKAKRS